VTVELPDGSTRETKTTSSGELIFGDTFQQGVYTATVGTNALQFCANLLDSDESDIRSRESLQLGEYGTVEATGERRQGGVALDRDVVPGVPVV